MATSIDWYFDFVSPYSYICLHRLPELGVRVSCRPVLFAGLLQHWGQKGPAEIPAKRKWTYRWCTWWARELDIPFRFPAVHPFNPLPYLRLSIAAGGSPQVVRRLFDALWTTGEHPEHHLGTLCKQLGVDESRLVDPAVKDQLRKNTDEAAAAGVFGVPSFVIDGEVFWGADAVDFANAFVKDAAVLRNEEMRRVDALPVGASRRQAG